MAPTGHCKEHTEYTSSCKECRFARMVKKDHDLNVVAPLGRNGGIACDVRSGPCNCGAWH